MLRGHAVATGRTALSDTLKDSKMGACDAVLVDLRGGEGVGVAWNAAAMASLASLVAGCVVMLPHAAAPAAEDLPANVCLLLNCGSGGAVGKLPAVLAGLRGKPTWANAGALQRSDMQALIHSMQV